MTLMERQFQNCIWKINNIRYHLAVPLQLPSIQTAIKAQCLTSECLALNLSITLLAMFNIMVCLVEILEL